MRIRGIQILAVSALVTLLAGSALAASALLYPTNSEGDLERQIGKYFEDEKGWNVDYSVWDEAKDDIILKVRFQAEDAPSISLSVDTFASAQDSDGDVTETRIKVSAWAEYHITPNHKDREKALETLNTYMSTKWVPYRVYLDKDGDVYMESMVNIPGASYPVHAEFVYDLVYRMVTAWTALYADLKAAGLERL
jgi:hypothetical protein